MAGPVFLPQAAPVFPANADYTRQLGLLGDTITGGIRNYQRMRLLGDVLKPDASGKIDYEKAAVGLIGVGEPAAGAAIANIGAQKENRAFRIAEAERAQRNADRSFGLQEKQLGVSASNAAATRQLAREQFEFNKVVQSQNFQLKLKEIEAKNQKLSNILSPGQLAADKKFADEYVTFRASGGYADVEKQISQLDTVLKDLESGKKGLTGPWVGLASDKIRAITNPEAVAAKNRVEEVVQRNLRTVLGAQFTEQEGERLIARAYNPQMSEAENASRLRGLIKQIKTMAQQKQAAADYFEKNGTIAGFKGIIPTVSSLGLDQSTPTGSPAGQSPAAVVDWQTYFGSP